MTAPTLTLSAEQARVLRAFRKFLDSDEHVFLLTGPAGTGKTMLLARLYEACRGAQRRALCLAPTGRAAQVLTERVGTGRTIHAHIYRDERFLVGAESIADREPREPPRRQFVLRDNGERSCVYLVDEASMIGDRATSGSPASFGSGRLLHDLIAYVFARPTHKLVLVGDEAQLPPVNEDQSPALAARHLETFGLTVRAMRLKANRRQRRGGAIARVTAELRQAIDRDAWTHARPPTRTGEVECLRKEQLIERFLHVQNEVGVGNAVIVVHSNRAAAEVNAQVRARFYGAHRSIQVGDLLVLQENNYLHDLLNGQFVSVAAVGARMRTSPASRAGALGIRTIRVTTMAPSRTRRHVEAPIVEDLLSSPERSLTTDQRRLLFADLMKRLRGRSRRRVSEAELVAALASDLAYNALLVKYGYAITCHKAQGGEWPAVFVVFSGVHRPPRTRDGLRWVYTACTRASERLFLVDAPW